MTKKPHFWDPVVPSGGDDGAPFSCSGVLLVLPTREITREETEANPYF